MSVFNKRIEKVENDSFKLTGIISMMIDDETFEKTNSEYDISKLIQVINKKAEKINSIAEAKANKFLRSRSEYNHIEDKHVHNNIDGIFSFGSNFISYSCEIKIEHLTPSRYNEVNPLLNEISCELHEKLSQEISELQKANL